MIDLAKALKENSYPGRGIVIGRSEDGRKAVVGYFIMGRSENSRNRVFLEEPDGIRTEAFDPSKMVDPSLIIYHPVRKVGDRLIVTNGDQTDTIADYLKAGKTFEEALRTRTFEPDGPNWTPRISGLIEKNGDYRLSILKSADGDPSSTRRYFFEYSDPKPGTVHFIHTYALRRQPHPLLLRRTRRGEDHRLHQLLYEPALGQPECRQQGLALHLPLSTSRPARWTPGIRQ